VRAQVMRASVAATAALTLLAVALLAPVIAEHGSVSWQVPALVGELRFRIDALSALCLALTALLWGAAALHAGPTLAHDPPGRRARYHATALATLLALVTLFSAADLITLYVGFEWLGLSAYLFVIHSGTPAAFRAGRTYLVLTLAGGFAVLTGALLVTSMGGGDLGVVLPLTDADAELRLAAALCLLLGFGVKAGALGLHVWLPGAHSVAPSSASALLSGVMLKAGAYGIARTLTGGVDTSAGTTALRAAAAAAVWPSQAQLAVAVLWWGVATMLLGVALALRQRHAKRLLAYSSISQMGVVLAALGAAGVLGGAGAIGWAGAVAHVLTHALAKALLFFTVGAVILAAGSAELDRLGGLARRLPMTFALLLVGAGALMGAPGTSGLISKSVVHHALEYSAGPAGVATFGAGAAAALVWAERLFVLTSVGTAAVMTKLVVLTFFGRPRSLAAERAREGSWALRLAAALPAGALVLLAVWPVALERPLASQLRAWGLPGGEVGAWLSAPLRSGADLGAVALAALAGVALFGLVERSALDRRPLPAALSFDTGVAALAAAWARSAQRLRQRRAAAQHTWASGLGAWRIASRWRTPGADGGAIERRFAQARRAALRTDAVEARVRVAWRSAAVAAWRSAHRAAARLDASWRLARDHAALSEAERSELLERTRRRIDRRSRDIGLALSALVAVWLLLLAAFRFG